MGGVHGLHRNTCAIALKIGIDNQLADRFDDLLEERALDESCFKHVVEVSVTEFMLCAMDSGERTGGGFIARVLILKNQKWREGEI